MSKHDYKVTVIGQEIYGPTSKKGYAQSLATAYSVDDTEYQDNAAELARRWNAEPELRAENERMREAIKNIESAAMPSNKLNEMLVPFCWIKDARAALEKGGG